MAAATAEVSTSANAKLACQHVRVDSLQACNVSLAEHDPEMFDIIEAEKTRQSLGLELIASEVRKPLSSNLRTRRGHQSLHGPCCTELHIPGSDGVPGVSTD